MEHILTRHCHVEAKLQSIGKVLPNVAIVRSEGEKFRNMIEYTNKLAEKVSAKVRQLDLARVGIQFNINISNDTIIYNIIEFLILEQSL